MAALLCPKCETRGSINHMKGEVTPYNPETSDPEVTVWTCPFCGWSETQTVTYEAMGVYDNGVDQGPDKVVED